MKLQWAFKNDHVDLRAPADTSTQCLVPFAEFMLWPCWPLSLTLCVPVCMCACMRACVCAFCWLLPEVIKGALVLALAVNIPLHSALFRPGLLRHLVHGGLANCVDVAVSLREAFVCFIQILLHKTKTKSSGRGGGNPANS